MIGMPSLAQLAHAASTRLCLCTGPMDMRPGFDRLVEQVQPEIEVRPQSSRRQRATRSPW